MKNDPNASHCFIECGCELLVGREPQAEGESPDRFRLAWHGVSLLFGVDLQSMLDPSQKSVRPVKIDNFLLRDELEPCESTQRVQGARFLQECMTGAVNELERLHHEFDLANAAASKLNVTLQIVRPYYVTLDPPFDAGDFVEKVRSRTLRVNKWLMLPQKFVSQLAAAANSTRFDQGEALPGFTKASIIIFHAFERTCQRPG